MSSRGGRSQVWTIVLNWNRREDSLECLASLAQQALPAGFEPRLLLVDNGSTDGSAEAVGAAFPAVEILKLPENLGYARGINAGLELAMAAGADWTLLVNNDTVAEPGLLSALLAAAAEDSPAAGQTASSMGQDIGMFAPTIVYHDRPERVWPSAGRRRRLTLAAIDTTADPPSPEPYDVDWATGCCLLVRAALWRSVGRMDPGFRVYYEDHDLCLRARAAGWRIQHVPAARIRHKVAQSTGEGSPGQRYLLGRSSLRYYWKHSRGPHRLFLLVYRLGSLLLTLWRSLRQGRPEAGRAYLRGLRDGLADLRTPPERNEEWLPTPASIAKT
jgi:GT2 family glycosyltransferase